MATQIKTVAQYREDPTVNPGDDIRIVDTGEAIASLTVPEIAGLEANFVIEIDASDDVLALSLAQFNELGAVALPDLDDNVSLADSSAVLNMLTPTEIAALATANVDRVDATDNVLAVDLDQLQAYGVNGVAFEATDTVTLAEFGAVLSGGDPTIIATLDDSGIDIIDALEDTLTYSIAAVQALGTVQLTAADVVTVQDTATAFNALTSVEIAGLAAKNVDILDITGGPVTLTVAELLALGGMTFAAGADVSVLDTASNIAALSPAQIAALSGQGVDSIDATDAVRAISTSDVTIGEGGAATFTVTLSVASAGPVSVTYATSNGTASADDFTAAGGTVAFAAGETSKTITIQTTQDDAVEADETFNVVLSAPNGAALADATGVGTITNDDVVVPPPPPVVPAISVSDAVIGEGGVATFTVTLSEATTGPVSVNYGTPPGSASVADFIAAGGALDFAAGETSKQITVQTTQDNLFEGDETFNLSLSNVSGGTLADATGVGVIVNDDLDGPVSTSGRGTSKSDKIQGSYRKDSINGKDGNDTIFGNGGNDSLKGGDGRDKLYGGNGDDNLQGQDGNDLLFGGAGKDWLKGGDGRDAFVFDAALGRSNVDKIVDFNVRDDSVYLDNAVFTALGSKGSLGNPAKLKSSFFTIGNKAKDANDHVIYDNKKGVLLYDADGKGGEAAVQFATVSKNLKMTAADFFVI